MSPESHDPLSTSWAELLRDKRSLAAIVRDAGRLCVEDSVDIVLDVCDELANAHANGIVHGDLGLHRVRTMWPRRPGDPVDIWTLDADDTGAIDFRAAFQAPALAPEQRAGRVGDQRADIWAVGAILHALISGQPPSKRPVQEVLAGAPRALLSCVESCLAEDPAQRPRSVDDVAGALASFASTPPERFQQLARRRIASLKAKHVPVKVETGGRFVAAKPVSGLQPIPSAPATLPTTLAGQVRMPSRPSYPEVSVSVEWPKVHGVPSMSIAVAPAAPSAAAPVVPNPRATQPMFNPSLYPSYPPPAVQSSPSPSMTPPPVCLSYEDRVSPARTPAPYIPPAPPAYRMGSYHPPSFGPMSIDMNAPEVHFPPAARVPSFSDLAEYREAKRASRKTATIAVIIAAATLILGFGYGARVLKEDRAAIAAAAAAPAPPPAPVPVPVASPVPTPTPSVTPSAAPAVSATPAPVVSATPAPAKSTKPAVRRAASKAKAKQPVAPAEAPMPSTSKDDRPEAAAPSSLSDALK